jgi:hypothetical protein
MKCFFAAALFLFIFSCGSYSFSGKSIPPSIKNAQLILFEDNTGRYDLSLPDVLNKKITDKIEDYNYFILENSPSADSKIYGTIRSYSETIVSQSRDETADQMAVKISVELNFFDNISGEFIVKNHTVTETEYYEASGGDASRNEAFEKLTERLSDSIVLGLSSNW